jgi:hypothetical protein
LIGSKQILKKTDEMNEKLEMMLEIEDKLESTSKYNHLYRAAKV